MDQETINYIENLEYLLEEKEYLVETLNYKLDSSTQEIAKLNDRVKYLENSNTEGTSLLQQQVREKDEEIKQLGELLDIKEQNLRDNEEVYTTYQEEVDHLFAGLENIFPELEVNENTDNTTFLKMLEESVEKTHWERSEDSKHIQYLSETINNNENMIEDLTNQLKQLQLKMPSMDNSMDKWSILDNQVDRNDSGFIQVKEESGRKINDSYGYVIQMEDNITLWDNDPNLRLKPAWDEAHIGMM